MMPVSANAVRAFILERYEDELEHSKPIASVVFFPYHEKYRTIAVKLGGKTPNTITQNRIKKAIRTLRKTGIKVFTKCPL